MYECRYKPAAPIDRVQKIGTQAIVGTFMTVAVRVAEAEASIPTVQDRLWKRVINCSVTAANGRSLKAYLLWITLDFTTQIESGRCAQMLALR
jgi:hypothetical protein